MNVDIRKQRMLYRNSHSCNLKAKIHESVSKDKVGYMELTIVGWIDWRSQ